MTEEKQYQIDIPESIDGYRLTLFWGLTVTQIILLFISMLFIGFGIFSAFSRHFATMTAMMLMTIFPLFGIFEIRGRNFYRHLLFILSYYRTKPRVLIYNHYAGSGLTTVQMKQLIYQKEKNTKLLIFLALALIIGLALLTLTAIYLYHVTHT